MRTYQDQNKPGRIFTIIGRVVYAEYSEYVGQDLQNSRRNDDPAVHFTVNNCLGDVDTDCYTEQKKKCICSGDRGAKIPISPDDHDG